MYFVKLNKVFGKTRNKIPFTNKKKQYTNDLYNENVDFFKWLGYLTFFLNDKEHNANDGNVNI